MRVARVAPLLLALSPAPALGQNLLTNGSFEAGYAGWDAFSSGAFSATTFAGCSLAAGAGTTCGGATVGTGGGLANVFQSIPTPPGQQYLFTGYYRFDVPSLDGDLRLLVLGPNATFTETACAANTTCFFSRVFTSAFPSNGFGITARRDAAAVGQAFPSGTVRFDQLSVTAVQASTVPEPGTWALLATGLVGLAAAGARRRRP
jgi:hypothetical protein